MLKIVTDSHSNNRAEFVVEGGTIEEIMGSPSSNMVIEKAATFGLHRPGVSNATGPYPVDEDGQTTDDVLSGKQKPAAYRRDFVVMGTF